MGSFPLSLVFLQGIDLVIVSLLNDFWGTVPNDMLIFWKFKLDENRNKP